MTNQVAIAIGLVAGLALGLVAAATRDPTLVGLAQGIAPVGTAFVNLFRMVVIPLVATTIFTGVAGLGDPRRLGRLGGATLTFFWSTSIVGIAIGMLVMRGALAIAPVTAQPAPASEAARELPTLVDFLLGLIPANPFEVAASGRLLPLIVFMVLFAAAVAAIPAAQRDPLLHLADAVTNALIKLVRWILWTAPLGVFALAASLTATSGWELLKGLIVFVIAVVVGLVIFTAGVLLPAAVLLGRITPRAWGRAMISPMAIGAGTTSSAAALPAMFESASDLKVPRGVAGLVLSLGAAINRPGSGLFQGAAVVFLAALYDIPFPAAVVGAAFLATFLVSLTVAGVPSASVVTLAPALDVVGVPLAGLAVLFGIDRIPDVLRSAVNVGAHVTAASVVTRKAGPEPPINPIT